MSNLSDWITRGDSLETHRQWSQRTPAVFPAFPPAPRIHEPAVSSPAGRTASPAWPPDFSGFHIPAGKTGEHLLLDELSFISFKRQKSKTTASYLPQSINLLFESLRQKTCQMSHRLLRERWGGETTNINHHHVTWLHLSRPEQTLAQLNQSGSVFGCNVSDTGHLPPLACVSLLYWCCLMERYLPQYTLPCHEPEPALYIYRKREKKCTDMIRLVLFGKFCIRKIEIINVSRYQIITEFPFWAEHWRAAPLPVLVHSGVSDGQRHHGHAVHVVWNALWFLHIPVHPAGPRDPLQVISTTTHKTSGGRGNIHPKICLQLLEGDNSFDFLVFYYCNIVFFTFHLLHESM